MPYAVNCRDRRIEPSIRSVATRHDADARQAAVRPAVFYLSSFRFTGERFASLRERPGGGAGNFVAVQRNGRKEVAFGDFQRVQRAKAWHGDSASG